LGSGNQLPRDLLAQEAHQTATRELKAAGAHGHYEGLIGMPVDWQLAGVLFARNHRAECFF
jgi:hypothetical protein